MEGSKRATQTWLVGPPDARKRACPVRGALGGNLLLQGSKAPSFDSIERQAEPVLRGSPGRCWSAATGIVRSGKAAYIEERTRLAKPPSGGCRGRGINRTGGAQRRRCLPY
jgi:hypothetical protein